MLLLSIIVVFPLLVSPAPAVSPAPLGQLESSVAFCARIDSKNADKYKDLGKSAIAGLTEEELNEIRGSGEYKDAFDNTTEELKKLSGEKALAGCRASLK